ncbi:MAG: rod shape-determining protein MreC [bacterium]|nr:rod shape-determining protein MreC [bacterium]
MKNHRNYSKYVLIALSVLCGLMLGLTSLNGSAVEPLRSTIGYLLVPLQSGVNAAGSVVYHQLQDWSRMKQALDENAQLKEQIALLTEENNRLGQEQYELRRLQELYELDQEYLQYHKVAARVIAKDSGNWFQVFRINKGSNDGIQVNMNVLSGAGLVGIVTDVGANYATVRSIIDDSSNVSAMSMQTGENCIVSGDLRLFEEGKLRVNHVQKDDAIQAGDRLVTSNISDVFLPGILIGYITELTIDANNLTKSGYLIPAADFDDLQEVLVITQVKGQEETGSIGAGEEADTEETMGEEGIEESREEGEEAEGEST